MIHLEAVAAGYRTFRLAPATLSFPAGTLTALIGPNGCGKSTMLKVMSRQLRPSAGRVMLGEEDTAGLAPRALARRLALLPQENAVPPGVTVVELVGYGRAPHQNLLGMQTGADREKVRQAMDRLDLLALADREVGTLSGGQRQRVFIAMALAQDAPVMLFDEPTNWLDIQHQVEVLRLMRDLAREGRTCVVVLHDIAQAARYADRLVVMKAGSVIATGAPKAVLTADLVRQVYNLQVEVHPDPVTGTPVPVPLEPGRDRCVEPV
ncbi:ABC transporter ATP-binding protein [Salipiger mangrovisoli]|uniref:ATP-binding cassette domain-containing protein n=1 Tax=Salipiger mangrovisoli TaxID=2865933 RepID=A0ABR9WY66_9RHOB|nr:ATP-binding cassette domain-containing protein [Salipiger mangrovisoli]MBE9636223.1 ATP-binding cassette domain-containing protein [Salipiger mangrovisoli]